MKLKMALATLGLSVLGATSALAQSYPGLSIVIGAQDESTPGILDYNADFTYDNTAGGLSSIFIVPNGLAALAPGGGYTDDATGIALGLYPLELGLLTTGPNAGTLTGTINEIVFSLNYDNTAVDATGTYDFFVYDADPFTTGQVIATVPAGFLANVPGTVVPEPGTVALLVGMGVAGVAFRRRRK